MPWRTWWGLALMGVAAGCSSASSSTGVRPPVRTVTYPGPFVPQDVFLVSGTLWLFGWMTPEASNSCAVERLDPHTMKGPVYPLPGCGPYVDADDGHLFIAAVAYESGTNSVDVHLESFDTATGRATVMAPMITTFVGSEIAHVGWAYGRGSVWLHPGPEELFRISPSTGAVTQTVTDAGEPGGAVPALVANAGGVWVADGAGGGPDLRRVAPGSAHPSVVYQAPSSGSVLGLWDADGWVWAETALFPRPQGPAVTRLEGFDLSGHRVVESPPEEVGDSLVAGAGDDLWSTGPSPRCGSPQRLWSVNAATGRDKVVATLSSPRQPCLSEEPHGLVADGRFVFVLVATGGVVPNPSVLYRVTVR